MSYSNFTKENLDTYLKELAKEFRKRNGKSMPAEIVLVGGAAILTNYGFRDVTTDVDAIIHAASSMKDAVNYVADKFGLPNGWLNADFTRTASYSPKLDEFSVYYKTFYGVLSVRAITAEYLIAMKLRSGRKYKNDLSDIIGILVEHEKRGNALTFEKIEKAVMDLYGGWGVFSEYNVSFIKRILASSDLQDVYRKTKESEAESKDILLDFEEKYPQVANDSNVDDILRNLKKGLTKQSE